MNRCMTSLFQFRTAYAAARRAAAVAAFAAVGLLQPWSAAAQMPESLGGVRTFPEQARRGTLVILSTVEAKIDGTPIRMAPGMRLRSPQNSLIMLHAVIGKEYAVNYTIEKSTGMLHTAWILNKEELALPREGGGVQRNFRFESDANPR